MEKKYIVRLTDEERATLRRVIKKLQGSSEQVRRAHMLLKADANGPNGLDHMKVALPQVPCCVARPSPAAYI